MNSMTLAFNAVFPLLAFMVLGYFLGYIKLLDSKTASVMNILVFRVFLPLSIFQSIYDADIGSAFDLKLTVFIAITSILFFILLSLTIGRMEKDKTIAPVMVQGIHKANYNLLVLSIVSSFFGKDIGMAAVLVIIITPIVNTCSTIAFENARGNGIGKGKGIRGWLVMLKKIVLNPMVSSCLLGLLANVSGIRIPALLMNSVVSKLGAMATPIAMLALGAGFDFKAMKKWLGRLAIVSTGKLIVLPLITVTVAALLGIRGPNMIAVLLFSGAPAAVNSYSTAVSMGGNGELAGEIVAVTSILSVFTLFVFLTVMGNIGLI